MSTITITDINGEDTGVAEIPDELLVFDRGEQAVRDVVVAHMAGLRSGTASTLTKGLVAGSNKKPWKQKGLGRARAGYRQSPIWRGGGVVFGPRPRSYDKKVSKKMAHLAFRRAFSDKVSQRAIRVVDGFEVREPKTRLLLDILKSLRVRGKALIVVEKLERNGLLASRNLQEIEMVSARNANTYQFIRYPLVIITPEALAIFKERLKGGAKREAS